MNCYQGINQNDKKSIQKTFYFFKFFYSVPHMPSSRKLLLMEMSQPPLSSKASQPPTLESPALVPNFNGVSLPSKKRGRKPLHSLKVKLN